MTQRQVIVRDAGHQALDELDAADIPALSYETAGAAATAQSAAIAAAATDATTKANAAQAAAIAASQPVDSDLTAIAALTTTSYGRGLLALADAAALRTSGGLGTLATQSGTFSGTSSGTNTGDQTVGTIATQNANAVAITGGSVTGITDVTVADGGTGASTAAAARTNLGIAGAVGGTEWTTITKASDESVTSSTTLQNDDELLFTTVSGGVYEVEIVAIYVSPVGAGTPDFKAGVGEDTTVRGVYSAITYLAANDTAGGISSSLSQTNTGGISIGTAATNRVLIMRAWHVGAGGTFKFIWGQNTSDANATTVKAGSVLRYRRLL